MTRSAIGPLLGASLLAIACGPQVGHAGDAGHDGDGGAGPSSDAGSGVDVPPLEHCGDGVLDDGEACDDGNDVQGDGCNADCRVSGQLLRRIELAEKPISDGSSHALAVTAGGDVVLARRVDGEGDTIPCPISSYGLDGETRWERMLVSEACRRLYATTANETSTFGVQTATPATLGWQLTDVDDDGSLHPRSEDTDPTMRSFRIDLTAVDQQRVAELVLVLPPDMLPRADVIFDGGLPLAPIVIRDIEPIAFAAPTSSEIAVLSTTDSPECHVDWLSIEGQPIRTIDVCALDDDELPGSTDIAADGLGGIFVAGKHASALVLAFDANGEFRWRIDAADFFATPGDRLAFTQLAAAPGGDVMAVGDHMPADGERRPWIARIGSQGEIRWAGHVDDDRHADSPAREIVRTLALSDEVIWVSGHRSTETSDFTWLRAYTP